MLRYCVVAGEYLQSVFEALYGRFMLHKPHRILVGVVSLASVSEGGRFVKSQGGENPQKDTESSRDLMLS